MRRTIFLPLVLLLLLISNVLTQDDEDDEGDDDDDDSGNVINEFDNFDNGYFPLGSENFDEIPGGLFESDSDGDPIDYMDSNKNPSVSPRFSLPSLLRHHEPDTIINNGERHHFHSSSHNVNNDQVEDPPAIRNDPDLLNAHHGDSYDPDRRRRYTGYDDEDSGPGGHEDSGAAHDMNQDFDRFPKGSFYDFDGLYGNSKRVHERLFSPYKGKTSSRTPCDGGCDE